MKRRRSRAATWACCPEDEADAVVVPLVERLRSRLGDDAVALLATQAEHRPEYAASEAPSVALKHPTSGRYVAGTPARHPASAHPVNVRPAKPAPQPREFAPGAPRPLWLLDAVRPLRIELEAQPWILRDGPERIESGWWDGRDLRRDYFVAENPHGETVWVYRDHRYGTDDGEWFMHGLFA